MAGSCPCKAWVDSSTHFAQHVLYGCLAEAELLLSLLSLWHHQVSWVTPLLEDQHVLHQYVCDRAPVMALTHLWRASKPVRFLGHGGVLLPQRIRGARMPFEPSHVCRPQCSNE